jgi:hypothetical protein
MKNSKLLLGAKLRSVISGTENKNKDIMTPAMKSLIKRLTDATESGAITWKKVDDELFIVQVKSGESIYIRLYDNSAMVDVKSDVFGNINAFAKNPESDYLPLRTLFNAAKEKYDKQIENRLNSIEV